MSRSKVALELIQHASRWSLNILVELGGNHGSVLNEDVRAALRFAHRALRELEQSASAALLEIDRRST